MSAPNDGGPAFPATNSTDYEGRYARLEEGYGYITSSGGMSLRDWFAGQALNAMFINSSDQSATRDPSRCFREAATNAYIYADAMLTERTKGQP